MTTRRPTRRQRHTFSTDPLVTHLTVGGITGVAGLALGMHACDMIVPALTEARSLLIGAAVTFVVGWLVMCLIRAIVTSVHHVWQMEQSKRYYRSLGYKLVDGVLFLNNVKVEM